MSKVGPTYFYTEYRKTKTNQNNNRNKAIFEQNENEI